MKHSREDDNNRGDRVISPSIRLRPERLVDYIGQKNIVRTISLAIESAKKRNEVLEHCIIYGPPGLGKTTLANIISKEISANIITTNGPAIEKIGDIAAILTNLNENDILFIDEIHRLSSPVEETLYSAIEDFRLDVIVGQGPGARTIRIDLSHFTLIGATTRIGLLTSPLRDRFGIVLRLDFYSDDELKLIIKRTSNLLNINIENDAMGLLAKCSRGTPRIANKLLRRVRDFAVVNSCDIINKTIVEKAFALLDINELGLDYLDKKYISTIIDKFDGGPVGLETLAASIGEDKKTLEDVVEPYLLQIGYIKRTPKGRMITNSGLKHLNIKHNSLF